MVGLSVRMGYVIANDAHKAKLMAIWCMGLMTSLGAITAGLLYLFRLPLIHLFTSEEDVIQMSLSIWPYVCLHVFLTHVLGNNEAVYRGLGMQWRLATIIAMVLYVGLLPCVIYFGMIKGGGLIVEWELMPVLYSVMQVILIAGLLLVDWEENSSHIRLALRNSLIEIKERMSLMVQHPNEQTPLAAERF